MFRLSNPSFLGPTLSCCHPERSERICGAPFVCPALTGPQPPPISPNPHGKTTSPLSFRVSRIGPRNRRSLGFARDDKKERVIARKEWLLNRGIFQIGFGQLLLNLVQDCVLGPSMNMMSPAGTAEGGLRRGLFPAVPPGLVVLQSNPGLPSWAKFSRPRSTSSGQALRD